jgi:hypothetical protein
MKHDQTAAIETNRGELEAVKKAIASKAEVNGLFQELNNSILGSLPTLPERWLEEAEVEEAEVEEAEVEEAEVEEAEVEEAEVEEAEVDEGYHEERRKQEPSREDERRRRFPFLRRF